MVRGAHVGFSRPSCTSTRSARYSGGLNLAVGLVAGPQLEVVREWATACPLGENAGERTAVADHGDEHLVQLREHRGWQRRGWCAAGREWSACRDRWIAAGSGRRRVNQIANNSPEQALLGGFAGALDDAVMESSEAHQNQMMQLAAGFQRLVFDMLLAQGPGS